MRFHIKKLYLKKARGYYTVEQGHFIESDSIVYKNIAIDLLSSIPWSDEELIRRRKFIDDITESEILRVIYEVNLL